MWLVRGGSIGVRKSSLRRLQTKCSLCLTVELLCVTPKEILKVDTLPDEIWKGMCSNGKREYAFL